MVKHIKADHAKSAEYAANVLVEGGIIIYPTDTLYGFGADATNVAAIEKINRIKGRGGPMSVLAANIETALNWMDISKKQIELVEPHIGGPQTIIIPIKQNIVSSKILGGDNTLGIRIPDDDFCRRLSRSFSKPITSTSVNYSGQSPLNNPVEIKSEFGSKIDLLIDGGTLSESAGSTIYMLQDNRIIKMQR